jgi:hypothetical protein
MKLDEENFNEMKKLKNIIKRINFYYPFMFQVMVYMLVLNNVL